jgi:hypothetical protein
MDIFFTILLIGIVVLLLIFNVYFRYNILKDYKYLIQNKVEFGAGHIFSTEKMEKEIIPRYSAHADYIRAFSSKIRKAARVAFGLIVLLVIVALIMKFR